MNEEVRSILFGTAALSVAGVIAMLLTLLRANIHGNRAELQAAVRVVALAVLTQGLHFVEEFASGFHERFPALLGLTPWSTRFFVSFNLFWLAIWGLSVWGLAARKRPALFPLWFLGIGCMANGLAHPVFSILTRGYFPGLVTSPFAGIVGILLLRRLLLVTHDHSAPGSVCA